MGVLTIHFLICSVLGCASVLSAHVQLLLAWLLPPCPLVASLQQQSASLRRQQAEVSCANDFPKWARLQRRIQAKQRQLQDTVAQQETAARARGCLAWLGLEAVAALGALGYAWGGGAAACLPPHLTGALGPLLAAPGCEAGQVSALAWLLLVRGAVAAVAPNPAPNPGLKGLYSLASSVGLLK